MNFYTLTYDANAPTKQQINIPTNTDCLIGVGVSRNGKSIPLALSSVQLGGLSADTSVNGYPSFSVHFGDSPCIEELDLDVDYEPTTLSARATPSKSIAIAKLELSANTELVGKTINAGDLYFRQAVGSGVSTSEAAVIEALDQTPFNSMFENYISALNVAAKAVVSRHQEGTTVTSTIFALPSQLIDSAIRAGQSSMTLYTIANPDDIPPTGVPYGFEFAGTDGSGKPILKIATECVLTEDDYISWSTAQYPTRTYKCADVMLQMGQPFEAKFKLIENVCKSQHGDIADIDFSNTVNIAGTLSDDTEFSFDALLK